MMRIRLYYTDFMTLIPCILIGHWCGAIIWSGYLLNDTVNRPRLARRACITVRLNASVLKRRHKRLTFWTYCICSLRTRRTPIAQESRKPLRRLNLSLEGSKRRKAWRSWILYSQHYVDEMWASDFTKPNDDLSLTFEGGSSSDRTSLLICTYFFICWFEV